MGIFKKFEESDVLHNTLIASPHCTYISGTSVYSGSLTLYDKAFQDQFLFWGLEEGDVRTDISKVNPSGVIYQSAISASATGKEKAKYYEMLQLISGSRPFYNAMISGVKTGVAPSELMYVMDYSSVFYDARVGECVMCWVSGTKLADNPVGSILYAETAAHRFVTNVYGAVIYHDGSGSLRLGSNQYLYRDEENNLRYNISASRANLWPSVPPRIYLSGAYGSETPYAYVNNQRVGYMIPEEGLAIIDDATVAGCVSWLVHGYAGAYPAGLFYASFWGHQEIPVDTYLCSADRGELNYSNNPTYYKSGTLGEMYHSGAASTYITKIGLYNHERRLVGVASMAQPIRKRPNEAILLKVRLDR